MRSNVLILVLVFLMMFAVACGSGASSEDDGGCETDTDCENGYICFNKTCVKGSWEGDDGGYKGGECDVASDCGDGYYCEDHFCYPITENEPDGDKQDTDTDTKPDGDIVDGDNASDKDTDQQEDGDIDKNAEADIDPEIEMEPEPELEIPDIPRTQQCYNFPANANYLPEPGLLDACTLYGSNCPQVTFQIQVPDNGGRGDVNMVHFNWTLSAGFNTVDDKEIQIQAPGMSNAVVWSQYNQTDMPLEFIEFWDKTRGIGNWNMTIIDKGWSFGSSGTFFNRVCITLVDPTLTEGIDWDSEQIVCSTFASSNFGSCSSSSSPCSKSETLTVNDFAITNKYPEVTLDVAFPGKLKDVEVRLYAPRNGESIVLWEQSGDVTAIPQKFTVYQLMNSWAKGNWRIRIEYSAITGTVTWNNFCVKINEMEYPDGDVEEEVETTL